MRINFEISIFLTDLKKFIVCYYFAYIPGNFHHLPNDSLMDPRDWLEPLAVERMNSSLKTQFTTTDLVRHVGGKNSGCIISTYDSITSSPIIAAGMQHTRSENDEQIK